MDEPDEGDVGGYRVVGRAVLCHGIFGMGAHVPGDGRLLGIGHLQVPLIQQAQGLQAVRAVLFPIWGMIRNPMLYLIFVHLAHVVKQAAEDDAVPVEIRWRSLGHEFSIFLEGMPTDFHGVSGKPALAVVVADDRGWNLIE